MREEEVNKIMDDITDDSSLCIIREALRLYEEKTGGKKYRVDWVETIICRCVVGAESEKEAVEKAIQLTYNDYEIESCKKEFVEVEEVKNE